MSVDLARFLRTTPLATLKKYLESVDSQALDGLRWKMPRHALTAELLKAIERFPRPVREKLLCDVDRVSQFEGDGARHVLRGVLPNEPDRLEEFDALEDVSASSYCVPLVVCWAEAHPAFAPGPRWGTSSVLLNRRRLWRRQAACTSGAMCMANLDDPAAEK